MPREFDLGNLRGLADTRLARVGCAVLGFGGGGEGAAWPCSGSGWSINARAITSKEPGSLRNLSA